MSAPLLRQVKASAGSGKTFDLTRRFLLHLARTPQQSHKPGCAWQAATKHTGWGDILAVTFTNSAAAEMQERVIRRLKETALNRTSEEGIAPEQAARWVDIILRQYGALNIRTIDSLLHLVVRTAALDLGLPPDFTPAFATEETLAPILDLCLERAWQGDQHMQGLLRAAYRSLLYHTQISGFMAGTRLSEHLRPLLDRAFLGTLPDNVPEKDLEERLDEAWQDVRVQAAALVLCVDEEALQVKKGVREVFSRCAEGDHSALGSAWLEKDDMDGCLLKAGQGTASPQAERAYAALCDAAQWLTGPGHILRKALELAPFIELAREMAAHLAQYQQDEGKVPGVCIPALAREVLELGHGVPAALCRLGSALDHILVDEFQDTSREQWQALRPLVEEALSRGGSLTWVGDIKQAIYGWRGGDASLFDGVLHDAGLRAVAQEPQCLSLDTNWRSLAQVVQFNNTLFSGLGTVDTARQVLAAILPKDTSDAVLDAATQETVRTFADAAQKVSAAKASGGLVTVTPVQGSCSADLDADVREALRQRLLDDLGTRRPYGDITILVRSNPAAAKVAAWLMEWQIPVITENSLLLAEHPLVAESVAFLTFLDTPQDNLAFWTVLNASLLAPCLGAEGSNDPARPSASALRHWLLQRRRGSVYLAFKEDFPLFWQQWFAPFFGKAGLLSPYDLTQEWFRLLRVEERFPEAEVFVRRFLEVLHSAAERGAATLGTFLEQWRQGGGDEKVPMPTGMDAVNIMTIHKSKGLQFPVVIIPWMAFSTRADSTPVLVDVDGLALLAPRCKEMGDIHYAAHAENAREALHLLYVALTRAEEELHLFHSTTPRLLSMRSLANGLEMLFPATGLSLPLHRGEAPPPKACVTPDDAPSPPLVWDGSACDQWRPMHWLPRLKVFRNPLQELGMSAKRRGILAHHCLEHLQCTGHAQEDAQRAVLHGLRTFALPVEDKDGSVQAQLTEAIAWFASLPHTAQWMRQGLTEQDMLDEEGKLHRADLLIPPTADTGWLVVDYKTGQDAERPLEEHVAQIRRYLRLLNGLPEAGPLPARGVLMYLDKQCCRMVTEKGTSPLLAQVMWEEVRQEEVRA